MMNKLILFTIKTYEINDLEGIEDPWTWCKDPLKLTFWSNFRGSLQLPSQNILCNET